MKKTSTKIFCAILFLVGTTSAFALDIKGTAPTFTGTGSGELNTAVSKAFNEALGKLKEETAGIDTKPEKFIQSWGNSAVFASHGATTRGYGEYKLFSFSLGPMIGLQLPGDPFTIMDEMDDMAKKLNDDKDISLGISPQVFNARLGINASKFLLENLYLGLHLGFITLNGDDFDLTGFSFKNFSLGVTANYQLIPQVRLAFGLLVWRGVNVGSGLIYQTTNIDYAMKMDQYSSDPFTVGSDSLTVTIDPRMNLKMDIGTVTIPLEATTAVKLLGFINIPVGVGVDLGFGKSDITIGMDGDVNVNGINPNSGISKKDPGNLSVSAGGDMPPSFFNLKFMTGIGLNFGPVILDVPMTFYVGNGYNIGVTVGVVW
jgi:hypothetical protein